MVKQMSQNNNKQEQSEDVSIEGNVYRVNQALARLGICSRREADVFIKNREVFVNSQLVEDFSETVKVGDALMVAGKPYRFIPDQTRLFCFYKPKGCITSRADDRGRVTVFNLLPKKYQNLMAIGRLDYNTEGLLLFTNDGEFARKMELPGSDIQKTYRVRAFGILTQEKLHDMISQSRNGITLDNVTYGKVIISYDGSEKSLADSKTNHRFKFKIYEGKNNEIRNIMQHFGFEVNRLVREKFGKYSISGMKPRDFFELNLLKK